MSVNTAHAQGYRGGVVIYAGERILIFCDGVELGFDCNGLAQMKGNRKGRIYLTTHRVIFSSDNASDTLQSFSIPFHCMKEVGLEQPVFGANYIKGICLPENNGWMGSCKFKFWFKNGGAIEFGQALLHAGKLASRNMRQQPPPYQPPMGNIYQAPPPAYSPPQGPNYGWVPVQTFPTAPPPEYVYTTDAPPPYPGVDPNSAPYPPQANGQMSAADAKAQEASGNAYYNPANPHNVYMPSQMAAPPSYSEATKKNQ